MRLHKIFLIGTMFLCATKLSAEVSISANLFLGRAFSANMARELLMTAPVNQFSDGNWNGFFSGTAVYQSARNGTKAHGIGAYPFWSNTNVMTIGDNSGDYNVDAYQFGMGAITPTTSTISLNPIIYQDGSDFMFYAAAKADESGLFFKVKSGISAFVINPNLTEQNPATAQEYVPGQLSLPATPFVPDTPDPALSMTAAFKGGSAQGDYRPMRFGLIDGIQSTGAHLSDTEITVGYNIVCKDSVNVVSIGARVSAPTGNLPTGKYLLQPINGRGGNTGVGVYIAGSFKLWECSSEQNKLLFNFMSNGMHLCTRSVIRSYDLTANGHGSKYLLVADYNQGVYQNSIQNLINVSTIESDSSFDFEGDAAFALSFISGNYSVDLGYNVWGRTKEKLVLNPNDFDAQRYAILGRQGIGLALPGFSPTASDACQPGATINLSVDPTSTVITSTAVVTGDVVGNATVAGNRISGVDAFDTTITGQYSAATSKFFAKFGYTWKDNACCPYLGLIGEVESSNISNNALPQWALSVEGGISL